MTSNQASATLINYMRSSLIAGIAVAAVAIGAVPASALQLKTVEKFAQPTYVTAPRGDHKRLFVVEREGVVRVMVKGKTRSKSFLDISGPVSTDGEGGLLSIAFDPRYENNRRFYTYSTDAEGDIRIDEFKRRGGDQERAQPGSRRSVLEVPHRLFTNHKGGQIQFGPDGMLYIATGDGGGANDPSNNAQSRSSLLGKMLRIDAATSGARPEIFATGLRNPYRFSFDRRGGNLAIGDVGQGQREEVDFGSLSALHGADFGWRCREGSIATPGVPPCQPAGRRVDPVFEYDHSRGCSITGGYVVRDKELGSLFGRYIYGDLCDPRLRSVNLPSGSGDQPVGKLRVGTLVSFGEDAGGCIYTVSLEGTVSKLVKNKRASARPC
ncbi:MAG: PQQ-dependent sugar dehydrogenase [Thermoleophilaceae bacterium]|nr:PQQ-dependent sugar dehydrogenase [Thermoleophilaceae bacterium]